MNKQLNFAIYILSFGIADFTLYPIEDIILRISEFNDKHFENIFKP